MKLERYAGIDIGSNGVRCLIMNIFDYKGKTEFIKAIHVRAPIRLGSDSFVKNEIQQDSLELLNEAMKAFSSLMKCYQVVQYRACATSALREATNKQEVIDYVYKNSGVKIELISGEEEAEIIYKTQISNLLKDDRGYLFIDVGGGSTEVSYYVNKKVKASQSFKIGGVRLLKNQVEQKEWQDLELFISKIKLNETTVAIGTGGNINSLYKKSEKPMGKSLTMNYLKDSYKTLKSMTVDERIVEYKFNPDRADVIVPALEIYITVMKFAKINEIYVPKMGLSDGIVKSLYENLKKK